MKRAGWGILGTGGIARVFATALGQSSSSRLVAVGSRDSARAEAFAKTFGADRSYGSYAAVLDDPAVEFAYIATPHTLHVELSTAAAAAGKHVLCEKPMAVTAAHASMAVEAARTAGVFLMEAFAFRVHPQTARLASVLEGGEIGELRSMQLAWGFNAGPSPSASYYYRSDLAGGSILDNGCYTVAMARRIAGHTVGRTYRDPDRVFGAGLLHPTEGVDLDAAGLLWWEGGIAAHVSGTFRNDIDKTVLITGTEGFIRLPAPYLPLRPDRFGGEPRILVERHDRPAREITFEITDGPYVIEADRVVGYAREGRLEAPEYAWDDMLGNMRTLDRWRSAVGVRYPDAIEHPGAPGATDRSQSQSGSRGA